MQITINIDPNFPRWLKRLAMYAGVPAALIVATAVYADVTVPNTFTSGHALSSTEMNANFKTLQDGINSLTATVAGLESALTAANEKISALEAATVPPGTVISYFGTSTPTGWLVADGTMIDSQSMPAYAKLVELLRSNGYGGPSTTQAKLPDLRGVFLRGQDLGRGMNPDKGGDEIGRVQTDAMQGHNHLIRSASGIYLVAVTDPLQAAGAGARPPSAQNPPEPSDSYRARDMVSDGSNGAPRIATETRPVNVTTRYLIKY